ncbi:MAG TPA: OmpH family outer membrane protein [Flavobacterium sp.]|nr:OmpH family outer membrane protein [Flavobacterium sp.]
MRNLRKLFLAAIMVVGFNTATQAQEVAHINVTELVPLLPESKTAKDELAKMQDKLRKEFETMQKDFQTKGQKYESEAATAGDALNATRMKEMEDMQNRIYLFQQNADQELGKKQLALTEPILTKVQAAIHKVARAKGYKYVLDSTIGSGVIMADGPDLMADVKKELKIN